VHLRYDLRLSGLCEALGRVCGYLRGEGWLHVSLKAPNVEQEPEFITYQCDE